VGHARSLAPQGLIAVFDPFSPERDFSSVSSFAKIAIPLTADAAGAIFGDDLSAQKARILLMLALHNKIADSMAIQKYFDR